MAKLLRLSLATLTFNDPANELFLSAGLGAYRILTLDSVRVVGN
jgi:hypothetical protein